MIGKPRGNVAGSSHNARTDGIAHGHGNAKANAQNLQELATVLANANGLDGFRVG